jgi:hypothetical protein
MTYGCQPGITTYYTVDVQGDPPVTLRDGESAAIQVGGRPYDVRLLSRREPPRGFQCADYTPQDGNCFDARAQNLTGITFDTGVAPACVEGNDRIPYVSFYAPSRTFDGQVFYLGRSGAGADGARLFGSGGVSAVQLSAPGDVFTEPTVGQEFWLTATDWIQALRGPQRGEILLSTVRAGAFPEIAQVLGITVTAEQDCAYSVDRYGATIFLSRSVFASTPPTRIRSGSVGIVTLGGHSYHAASRDERVTLWK